MGKSRIRFWLLASLALSVFALYAATPTPSHAQVVVDVGAGTGTGDGGTDQGDPDQPNVKTGVPGMYSTPGVTETSRRSLESNAPYPVSRADRAPMTIVRRSWELLYWSLRARWGW